MGPDKHQVSSKTAKSIDRPRSKGCTTFDHELSVETWDEGYNESNEKHAASKPNPNLHAVQNYKIDYSIGLHE